PRRKSGRPRRARPRWLLRPARQRPRRNSRRKRTIRSRDSIRWKQKWRSCSGGTNRAETAGPAGSAAGRSIVAVDLLAPLVALLRLDRKGGDRARVEPA